MQPVSVLLGAEPLNPVFLTGSGRTRDRGMNDVPRCLLLEHHRYGRFSDRSKSELFVIPAVTRTLKAKVRFHETACSLGQPDSRPDSVSETPKNGIAVSFLLTLDCE